MKTLKLDYGDILVMDCGYIDGVYGTYGGVREPRFDALKHVKTLHSGDDGCYAIWQGKNRLGELGVDSGRIWAMVAEFDCDVDVDCGLSGFILIKNTGYSFGDKDAFVKETVKSLRKR